MVQEVCEELADALVACGWDRRNRRWARLWQTQVGAQGRAGAGRTGLPELKVARSGCTGNRGSVTEGTH